MNRNGWIESLVGLVVLVVAGGFLVYAYGVSGRTLGKTSYSLDAIFGRVDGITMGSDVRIAGVKVGSVSKFALNTDTYEARVTFAIDKGVPIPDDSVAKIISDGVLGGAHIALEPGASEYFLEDGETITITQGSVDLLGIAVDAFTANAGKGNGSPDNNLPSPSDLPGVNTPQSIGGTQTDETPSGADIPPSDNPAPETQEETP